MFNEAHPKTTVEEVRAVFEEFDKNKSGFIEFEDLKTTLVDAMGDYITDEQIWKIINEADKNNDKKSI